MKLYVSREDYLESILVLQKRLGTVRSVDVAGHMAVSNPSVCVAVNTLKDGAFYIDIYLSFSSINGRDFPGWIGDNSIETQQALGLWFGCLLLLRKIHVPDKDWLLKIIWEHDNIKLIKSNYK